MEKKWIVISIVLAIICACVVMSIPVIKVAYTAIEPYSATETYYVTEPYEEVVKVPVHEDYHICSRSVSARGESKWEIGTPLSYTVIFWDWEWCEPRPDWPERHILLRATVKNDDIVGAWFSVSFGGRASNYSWGISPHTSYISSGESHIFETENRFDPNAESYLCRVKVTAIEKTVTKYHEVPKQRTVTKYRDVTKYKYISTFEYLMKEGA